MRGVALREPLRRQTGLLSIPAGAARRKLLRGRAESGIANRPKRAAERVKTRANAAARSSLQPVSLGLAL